MTINKIIESNLKKKREIISTSTDLDNKRFVLDIVKPKCRNNIIFAEWTRQELEKGDKDRFSPVKYNFAGHCYSVHPDIVSFEWFYDLSTMLIQTEDFSSESYHKLAKLFPNTFVDDATMKYAQARFAHEEPSPLFPGKTWKPYEHGFFLDKAMMRYIY
jgi:hypothetical protein